MADSTDGQEKGLSMRGTSEYPLSLPSETQLSFSRENEEIERVGRVAMTIKVYYRRNLKMSEMKLAAQVSHCVANLVMACLEVPHKIVVLKASDAKFEEFKGQASYVQVDLGLTELEPNTETCLGIVER